MNGLLARNALLEAKVFLRDVELELLRHDMESISVINSMIPKKQHDAQWTVDFMRRRAKRALARMNKKRLGLGPPVKTTSEDE